MRQAELSPGIPTKRFLNGTRDYVPSATLGYQPALDGLRGIAVLLVVAQHAGIPGLERAGGAGVVIFFVLSGFLITTLLLEERAQSGRVQVFEFYVRRARRLLPALGVFLIAMVVVGVGLPVIIPAIFYFANWTYALDGPHDPLVHLWTLSVEEQFYIAWPVIFLLMVRIPIKLVLVLLGTGAGVIAVARIASTLTPDPYYWTFFATHMRADALLLGCFLAISNARRPWAPGRWAIGLAIAGIAVTATISNRDFHSTLGMLLSSLAAVALVAFAAKPRPGVLSWAPLVYVGTISYGLYLWHRPMTWWARENEMDPLVIAALVCCAFLIAAASKRFIEEPFLRRRSARRAPAPAADAPT